MHLLVKGEKKVIQFLESLNITGIENEVVPPMGNTVAVLTGIYQAFKNALIIV